METWEEPQEKAATFEKLIGQLNEANIKYTVAEHKPVLTSEEAA